MAHTLTFESGITCTVNGTSVSSGYTLNNGDTIVASADMTLHKFFSVNGIQMSTDTLSLSDTDINIAIVSGGGSN